VLQRLCAASAAEDLQRDEIDGLLLSAAALGNSGGLGVLLYCLPAARDGEYDVAQQLLETCVQHRHSGMFALVGRAMKHQLQMGYEPALDETAACLLRTDDRAPLADVVTWFSKLELHTQYAQEALPRLLHLALQLGRSGAIRAVCNMQRRQKQPRMWIEDVKELLMAAARSNNRRTVQSMLLLPGAQRLPGGGLQLVMEECRQQGQHSGSTAGLGWLWPQQQEQQQQQRRQQLFLNQPYRQHWFSGVQICDSEQKQQLLQALADEVQQKQPLRALQLLRDMQLGRYPGAHARDMLPPGPVIAEDALSVAAGDGLGNAADDIKELLLAALQLQPGIQQQAWVELLCNARAAKSMQRDQKERLLLAAVDAAHINSCCKPLQELCKVFVPLVDACTVGYMCGAAVQLACLPALQLLLRTRAAQQFEPTYVAELMRWAISTHNSSSRGKASAQCGRVLSTWRPLLPGCTAARAEVFAAVCMLPGAQRIALGSLIGLFVRAMQQGNVQAVQQLCKLAAAAELDQHSVRGLLRWARVLGSRPGRDAVVAALCGLRGARGLSRLVVNKLLQLYDRIDDMMGWDAAQSEAEGVQPAEVSFGRL
jgi:hypothetical protein